MGNQIITQVRKRNGAIVAFNPERIMNAIYRAAVANGGRDKEQAENLTRQVVAELNMKAKKGDIPHIEDIQDIVEKVLIKNGHDRVAKSYILYRNEAAGKRSEEHDYHKKPSENIPWSKIWQALDWSIEHNLHTIDGLNHQIAQGEFDRIVRESETFYEKQLDSAAALILDRADQIRMVFISGPSSSGKTTTTIKIEKRLKLKGLSFRALNVDHYFYDLKYHPKDEFGDYDFETPQALDLELINKHLQELAEGKEILVPIYDFKTGTRKDNQTPMKLEPNEILLIDSLHGLYPEMSSSIPDELKFRLYLEPMLQMKMPGGKFIRWTDIRMMRRMLRDAAFRAYKPEQTLLHWHYVRSAEKRHIIPYSHATDYIINSGMPYEVAIYRDRLFDEFERWTKELEGDPLRIDAWHRAQRVYNFLKHVKPVKDVSAIPEDSVIREFIGGSVLDYH